MDRAAEEYVRLVLAVGVHDDGYVDAYYGPAAWREEAAVEDAPLAAIRARADAALARLPPTHDRDDMEGRRARYLRHQLSALVAYVRQLDGERLTFDEESHALYDAVAPEHPDDHFATLLDELNDELPGGGSPAARYEAFRATFVIAPDRLDAVFRAAIGAGRDRTRAHLDLPDEEEFRIEYVTDRPWSGYNWYQGGYRSLIQVNTDLPVYVDRALDLACHEGYPGHHAYNTLLEQQLVRGRGWPEFSVYPLFSPQSLIAEGTANYGIEMAFPADERVTFEQRVLYPLAGIDPSLADRYRSVQRLVSRLDYAGNEAARRYLDGAIDREGAVQYLTRFALMSPERARQRLAFVERYRSYVINYNLGLDLVRRYLERGAEADGDPVTRWRRFADLLTTPRVPSDLTDD